MKTKLDDVTLVQVDCVDVERAKKSLDYSTRKLSFKRVILFTDKEYKHGDYDVVRIPTINNVLEYCNFVCIELSKYITTSFVLITQYDGFVIRPDLWTDKFLEYDYVGAPWPLAYFKKKPANMVGNGGFSLRSQKCLKEFAELYEPNRNEDWFFCINKYEECKERGVRFADFDVARLFSYEHKCSRYSMEDSFGFHNGMLVKEAERIWKVTELA